MHSRVISKCICSGALGMPFILILMGVGLVCKIMERVYLTEALGLAAADSLPLWNWDVQGNNATSADSASAGFSSLQGMSVAADVLFPIAGIFALKSMKRTENIRETIELAVPVCGLNSVCILCIIYLMH